MAVPTIWCIKVIDFKVGAIPGEEFNEIGRDMEESEKAAKYLQDAGYDALNTDNGSYDSWYWHILQYICLLIVILRMQNT